MPIIEVKAFEGRFQDPRTSEEVIAKLTDALCDVYGEDMRDETWVLLTGVDGSRWGFGGKVRK